MVDNADNLLLRSVIIICGEINDVFERDECLLLQLITVSSRLINIVVVIRRYVVQLEEEREYRHEFRLTPSANGTYEAKEGLLTDGGHYAYSEPYNSFGARK